MFLVVTRNFPPELGGMQVLMEGLSKELSKHGAVKIYADECLNSNNYDSNSSLDIERIKGFKFLRKYRKANLVNDFINSSSGIKGLFVDHWKSLELLKVQNLKTTKVFCLLHGKEINHKVGSFLNKRVIQSTNKADFIIPNSNFTKKLAIKVGINSSKMNIIFPGIRKPTTIENLFKTKAEKIFEDAFPKIITVARLDKRKGHDKILMAIKNLKTTFPKIKYISIGFGDQEKKIKKLSKELFLDKEVIFLKNIEESFKLALISESNLFLMPSRTEKKSVEGFGISYIEAASYGVGSIGGKDGGAPDAISHNKTGLICDGEDLNSIYQSIIDFFKNEKFIDYGKNAKKFSESFYWSSTIKNYLKLMD